MTDLNISSIDTHEHAHAERALLGHPDDVLKNARLSTHEKRCLLASWASDANAIPHLPSLRQLPDGSIVPVDDIFAALKALDVPAEGHHRQPKGTLNWRQAFKRRKLRSRHWTRFGRWPRDDDDPPPCPAIVARLPRGGGGAAAAEPYIMPA
jgi:hypothetical protein